MTTYGEARDALAAGGYAPVPIPAGAEIPPGPFAAFQVHYGPEYAGAGVGVLGALAPPRSPACVARFSETHLAALTIMPVRNRKIAADVDAVVSRYVGGGPVRVDSRGQRVYPLRLPPGAAPFTTKQTHGTPLAAKIESHAAVIVISGLDPAGRPYTWPNGSLLEVHHDALPAIDAAGAAALIDEISDVLTRHVAMPPEALAGGGRGILERAAPWAAMNASGRPAAEAAPAGDHGLPRRFFGR